MGIGKHERWVEFRREAVDDMQVGNANPVVIGDVLDSMAVEMEKQSKYFDPGLPMTFRFLAEANKDPFGATKAIVYGRVKSAENLFIFLAQRALGIGKKPSMVSRSISQRGERPVDCSLFFGNSDALRSTAHGVGMAEGVAPRFERRWHRLSRKLGATLKPMSSAIRGPMTKIHDGGGC